MTVWINVSGLFLYQLPRMSRRTRT